MILKGNQRAGGSDLALHLMNAHDNERIEIGQIRGTVAVDLYGALGEYEAIAAGTRCTEPLYSLSINPSAPLTREQYIAAVDRIEEGLGLAGQPRAIIFHVKNGREHCHAVWSRIDAQTMRAKQLGHDRMKLRTLSRELAAEFGLNLPDGLARDAGEDRSNRKQETLAEKAQAAKSGLSPEDRRKAITDVFRRSDGAEAFRAALAEKGYVLARGDSRGFVVVDKDGAVHSLARQIEGAKAKQIKDKLAPLTPGDLPSVAQARETIKERQKAFDDIVRARVNERLKDTTRRLSDVQSKRRTQLDLKWQQVELIQRSERLALHAAQKSEMQRPFARAAATVFALFGRIPALRSVLRPLLHNPALNPLQRHSLGRAALDRRHVREKSAIAREGEVLAKLEAKERQSLRMKLRQTLRVEETSKLQRRQERSGQFATNMKDVSTAKEKAASKNDWAERKEQLGQTHGVKPNRPPGYRLKRDDPS